MDERFKTDQKFSDILKEKDPILFTRLKTIKREGLEEWVPLLNFDRGSHAGFPHLLNVERNADKMIPDSIKREMTGGQIFLLLAAIFLHDIGKLTAARLEAEEEKNGHKIRLHHQHSEEIITNCWAELGLPDERIARYIGKIAWYHCIDDPLPHNNNQLEVDIRAYNMTALEPYGRLRIPFIAAILRIADETEASWTRSLQKYLYERIKESTDKSMIKGVRRLIEEVEFCLVGECIIFHVPELRVLAYGNDAKAPGSTPSEKPSFLHSSQNDTFHLTDDEFKSLTRMKSSTDAVLKKWSTILEEQNLPYKQAFYEHKNMLLTRLIYKAPEGIEKQKLAEVLSQQKAERRPGLQELIDAIVSLSRGSLGHDTFSWQAIEAKIGHAITPREKWIVERMNYVSSYLYITFPSSEKLKIHLDRDHISDLYQNLGCKYKGAKHE